MSHPTGYQESPDTTDGPVGRDQTGDGPDSDGPDSDGPDSDAPLTTDDEAQADDEVMRPGNVSD